MRILFALLVIANGVLFALHAEVFGRVLPDGREPERLAHQISPEKLTILPQDADVKAVASAAPRTLACIEWGAFNPDDAARAGTTLDGLGLTSHTSSRRSDESASYIVYLPPFKSRADAERAATELRRIGVNDFFVIQDPGPFKLAISLGVFRTEEAAKAQLTTLSQLGVKNARTGERPTTVAKVYYQLHNLEPENQLKLAQLKTDFPGQDLHDCPAAPPAAAAPAAPLPVVAAPATPPAAAVPSSSGT